MNRLFFLILFAGSAVLSGLAAAAPKAVPYPLPTCVVSDEHLDGGDMVVYVHKQEGKPDRIMHFCCRKCLAKFKADPAKYLEKLDAAAAKGGKKS